MQSKYYLHYILVLLLLPQFIMATSFKHLLSILLLGAFLFFLIRISKTLFYIFALYISVVNSIQANISFHWGGYNGDIASRISVALQSPHSETIEYMNEYINYLDYMLVVYTLIVLVLSYPLLQYTKKRNTKVLYIFTILSLLVLQNQEPLKSIKYLFRTVDMNNAILERSNLLNSYSIIKNQKEMGMYDKIIIVQGESANKLFLGVYNKDLNTTPFLSSLQKKGYLHCFNAISASNQTRFSVPTSFTDANVLDWFNGFKHELSIITTFKENNYFTYWLSTQGHNGLNEDSITSIAREADSMRFFGDSVKKDAILVEYLKSESRQSVQREVFVFHLMGSHFSYEERYPRSIQKLNSNNNLYIDNYKNSIYYTDLVLQKILNSFDLEKDKVLLIYFSDHGEVVSEKLHGHGYFPSYKDEYEIPFCVFSNIVNMRLQKLKEDNKERLFNAENMNSYIKYISGITNIKNISHSTKVFSLDPKNVVDYKTLKRYEEK